MAWVLGQVAHPHPAETSRVCWAGGNSEPLSLPHAIIGVLSWENHLLP